MPSSRTLLTGQNIPRLEDLDLITGTGNFTEDLNEPGQAHMLIVRSPHAHAEIESIDKDDAATLPGVLGVYTSGDLKAAGIGAIPSQTRTPPFAIPNLDGSQMAVANQYPLAVDRVRYVGAPVAIIVAETLNQARDAAEALVVSYQPLDAVISVADAHAPDAPQIWDDAPGNRSGLFETAAMGARSMLRSRTPLTVSTSRLIIPASPSPSWNRVPVSHRSNRHRANTFCKPVANLHTG